jgi:O-antigen/teichoic acid export membrane protein
MSITIYFCLAGVVVLLAETIGLWFLNTQLNIPPERMFAANWVYQFSILATCVGIINISYDSAIVSHEKMSFFAYLSILEAVLKLVIVFLLVLFSYDKLILLGGLSCTVSFIIFFCHKFYCNKYFIETLYKPFWDKSLFRELISFSGWNVLGAVCSIICIQGVSILFNFFYGVKLNAAFGITNQVNSAVMQFIYNFNAALNPQINKAYAQDDHSYLHNLIIKGAKFSFFLFFVISIPIVLNMEFLLTIWLKNVPDYTVAFCRILLITSLVVSIQIPFSQAIVASGKVMQLNIITAISAFIWVSFTYLFLKIGFSPVSYFYVGLILHTLGIVVYMFYLKHIIKLSIQLLLKNLFVPCFAITCFTIPLPIIINNNATEWYKLLFSTGCFFLISFVVIPFVGMSKNERNFFFQGIQKLIGKIRLKI